MVKVYLGLVFVTLIWGYTWVTMKMAIIDIPPLLFSSLRLLIGSLPLFVILILQKKHLSISKEDLKSYLTMSILMSLGYLGILSFAMQFVSSGIASVLVYMMPIFVTLLSRYQFQEKLDICRLIGVLSAVIGLVLILWHQTSILNIRLVLGELLILLSALCWGIANVFSKIKFYNTDIIHMNAWQLFLGALMLFFFSSILEIHQEVRWSIQALASLTFNGLFSTSFTFVVWFWVLKKMNASKASMSLMMVPVFGIFFGWLQLGETVTKNVIVGTIFISLGILLNSTQRHNKET